MAVYRKYFVIFLLINFFKHFNLLKDKWESIIDFEQNYIRKVINSSVDPCENIRQFSCGNWNIANSSSVKEYIEQKVNKQLKYIFSSKTFFNNFAEDDIINQAYTYYQSCLNVQSIKVKELFPLKNLIKKIVGDQEFDSNWKLQNINWITLIAKLRLYGAQYLISSQVNVDIQNSSNIILFIEQPQLYLENADDYYFRGNLRTFKENIKKLLTILGTKFRLKNKIASKLIDFEIKLGKISLNENKKKTPFTELYKRVSVGELKMSYPEFDWFSYLQILWNKPILENEFVFIEKDYIEKLMPILKKTKPDVILKYAIIKFAMSKYELLNIFIGNRENTCLQYLKNYMNEAVGFIYIRNHISWNVQEDVQDIAKNIKNKFAQILNNSKWMDQETLQEAVKKLNAVTVSVGLPDFINLKTERMKLFKGLDLQENTFFENTLKLIQRSSYNELFYYEKFVDLRNLFFANAYYTLGRNKIGIGSGFLQPPIYHSTFRQHQKYGILGFIIAHEISHAFDNIGRYHDEKGIARYWWTECSNLEYNKRLKCFINQYNSMIVLGEFTLPENIADNIGLLVAFETYKDLLLNNTHNDEGKYEHIEGLNLTSQQLFFVNFVQWKCQTNFITTFHWNPNNRHPPNSIRIDGSLANSKEFSKHFNCAIGSPLNPPDKCKLF